MKLLIGILFVLVGCDLDRKMAEDADCSDEEETLFLLDTAFENGLSFADCWKQYKDVEDFLRRDKYISVRGTVVISDADLDELEFQSDIDGVSIVWKNIGHAMLSDFRHLDVLPGGASGLKRLFPILKKHLKLSDFSANSIRVLKEAVGAQIIYDGQWETWIGFVPDQKERKSYPNQLQRTLAEQFMVRLRINFQIELGRLWMNGEALNTLAKNNLNNASRIFVLPGDQKIILESFERAFRTTDLRELPNFKKVLFTFRFGDKWRGCVPLPIADESEVEEICVHVGHMISSRNIDLFWSKQGIKEVAGQHGRIISAFSFGECANFQTCLDGRTVDISGDLRNVCVEDIRFVQMYSDLPHRYPRSRVHPVSASVLNVEGVQSVQTERSIRADALSYLSEIENNFAQCRDGVCRLEFVVSLNRIRRTIDGADLIRQDKLELLLGTHALLVPFLKKFKVIDKLKRVGLHLHKQLFDAYSIRKGTGDNITVWKSFQCELAVEKLLWGHPMTGISRIYCINLGPGLEYSSRSRTDQMGFLCLEDCSACCADEKTLPPLCLYSKDVTMQRRIENVSGLFNLIGGSKWVLGRNVLWSLLKDFHTVGHVFLSVEDFILMLKTSHGNANKRIVGAITVADLVDRLMVVKKAKWPMVFVVVRKLLQNRQIDVKEILTEGIQSLSLGYFPAFRTFDESRHEGLNWQYKYGYWVIVDISDKESEREREAGKMHAVVLSVLEKLKLCHSSQYIDSVFPWIKPVLEKIAEKKLTVIDQIQVLVFVSCVALIQLGRYVNFYKLNQVERHLPLTQSMLKTLEIQCKFQLPGVNTTKLYRLHPSIPIRLDLKRSSDNAGMTEKTIVETNIVVRDEHVDRPERIGEFNMEDIRPNIDTEEVTVMHKPSNGCFSTWTSVELSLLHDSDTANPGKTMWQKWKHYQERCREMQLPDRSFQAFKKKMNRSKKTK